MINNKEYKFIKTDRFNATTELNINDIANIKNNITSVKFNLTYIAYMNFEIMFKVSEKLDPNSKMSDGIWVHSDSHLAEAFSFFVNESMETYDSPTIIGARIYQSLNIKY